MMIRNRWTAAGFILIPAIAMLMTGCGRTADRKGDADNEKETITIEEQQEKDEEPAVTEEEDSEAAPADVPEDWQAMSEEELAEFTDMFNSDEYNGFLSVSFAGADDIDWEEVLRLGAGLGEQDIEKSEVRDYLKAAGAGELFGDLIVVRRRVLDDYIRSHTGSGMISETDIPSWIYIKENDSFYREVLGHEQLLYECISGEKLGSRYRLRFRVSDNSPGVDPRSHTGEFADRDVEMTKVGDDLKVISNTILSDGSGDDASNTDDGGSDASAGTPDSGDITDEQALAAIRDYCLKDNPDLQNIVNEGEYETYWTVTSSDENEIVVLFRSYTAALISYHVDRHTGDTYVTEFVPGIMEEEERSDETLNVRDYMK